MAELKTKVSESDVFEFINALEISDAKKADSLVLVKLMEEVSGHPPKLWGTNMVGFDQYHYKSERSSQEGDWFVIGFSPKKAYITVYGYTRTEKQEELLQSIGKVKLGKGCIYVNKLADINLDVLKEMMVDSIKHTKEMWG